MHPDHARRMRDQFAAAGRPWLFKQWGEWCDWGTDRPRLWMHADGRTADHETAARAGGTWTGMFRPGKAAAGRLLDGIEHNGFPR